MKAKYVSYILNFKRPAGTSRGVLKTKETFFIKIWDDSHYGIGECGLFRGLSLDDTPEYEQKLAWACNNIHLGLAQLYSELMDFPSIQIGLEMAFKSYENANPFLVFPSNFFTQKESIPINGLIWMGDPDFMKQQIAAKIEQGFSCIKMKIGAIDFNTELELLKQVRNSFSAQEITLRVDANGAFSPEDAMDKLSKLAALDIHSIEQPIKAGQWELMAELCANTPLPIALDEELIGITSYATRAQLLEVIKPQYIILKPTLIGGFKGSDNWINLANKNSIKWWITSALESNVGLNAICQYTFTKNSILPQGLGTGSLFVNNFESPLQVIQGAINYDQDFPWNSNQIDRLFNTI